MSKTAARVIGSAALVLAAVGLAPAATPAGADVSDHGYFLSLRQKGQLVGKGQIQDSAGTWYDIWIVPGYVAPTREMGTYLRRTGADFAEYAHVQKYEDLARHSGDAFGWAYRDCAADFVGDGVPKAWRKYWTKAGERTDRRVFGWWFAYPWAFLEGTVDTAVRVPVGLTGTVLGTAWGSAVVPVYYAVNSTVEGSWHLAVRSVAVPAVGYAWNTVIAPPMAILGQKPAPSRVDGFWVKQLDTTEAQVAKTKDKPITPKDIETLALWGRTLMEATQPAAEQRQKLQKQIEAERAALTKLEAAWAAQADEERRAVRSLGSDSSLAELIRYLREQGFDGQKTAQASADVRRHLEGLHTLSPAEVSRIMDLLVRYPLGVVTVQPERPKTDPVKNSVQVIQEIR